MPLEWRVLKITSKTLFKYNRKHMVSFIKDQIYIQPSQFEAIRKTMDRTLMLSQITCISLVKITVSQTLNLISQEKD